MSPTRPVRISAGYSDKISENYNSKQFSINLELDANINGSTQEIEDASARLFELCRKIVEQQKGVSVDSLLAPTPQQLPPQQPQQNFQPQTNIPSSNPSLASPAQVKCIFAVAKQNGLQNGAIAALANRFNKPKLDDLSKQEASILIKELKGN